MTSVDVEEWRGIADDKDKDRQEAAKLSALLRTRTRRLLGELARPHKAKIWLYSAAIVLSVLAQTAIPALVGVGIDRGIPDARAGDDTTLVVVGLLIIGCAVLQALLYRTFVLGIGRIGQDILFELRQRVFAHFQRLSLAFHEWFTSGRMISRLTSDIDAINTMLDAGLDTLVTAVLSIVMVGGVLLWLDLPLGLVALTSFVPLVLLSRWYQRRSTVAYRRTREAIALVIVHFTESLRGVRAVHAFRREPRNDEIFQALNDDYRATMTTSFQLLTVFWPGIRLIGNTTTAVVLLVGGLRVIHGDMKVGVLAAFVLYLRRFFEPIADVSQFYDSFQGAAAGLEKLANILDEEPSVPMPQMSLRRRDGDWDGEVQFDDVTFAYRDQTYVLDHFELRIPAGQTLALLGRTGAGKSTIARLLARFYDPQGGEVRVDGIPLRELSEKDLRQAVAMVTQEAFLFTGSVADNVAFGRPSATRAEVEAAGAAVGLDVVVRTLPRGYDESVGKNGARLSAGQRQLIALARAILADPAVLILDEASSSLDAPTERLVQRALTTVLAGRTALIIAHRLSTVGIADRVVVLEEGEVVEDGTPSELIAADTGEYAALHRQWQDSLV
jgi:ATP-binding cassette subfamily B protein